MCGISKYYARSLQLYASGIVEELRSPTYVWTGGLRWWTSCASYVRTAQWPTQVEYQAAASDAIRGDERCCYRFGQEMYWEI